jgi:type I restriction-modification system DNA methylase subunit
MPNRYKIIDIIGKKYYESNIENGEFSYPKALKDDLKILKEKLEGNKYLDIRFTDKTKKVSVLVETKAKFNIKDEEQLFNYVELEKRLEKTNDIIAILANTTDDKIKVWKVMHNKIEKELLEAESKLKSFSEYTSLLEPQKANDKEKIIQSTYELNEILHKEGIDENLRSQFVGTILLSLKNGLNYNGLTTSQILAGIKEILNRLVEGLNKAEKLVILDRKIIQHEHIRKLESKNLIRVLDFIKNNILPYINDNTNEGQDLLNLFFTTFNKYVGKKDKNQAFTPDHIVHFMCKVAKVDRNSRTLDPTCGSGAFLVQAMVQSLKNCRTEAEKNKVKKEQIYGIEYEEQAFGLATTNMLIHGDGNTNVINADCFKSEDFIRNADINVVLMNPPYNAQKKYMPKEFTDK